MLPRTLILLTLLPMVFAPWGGNPGEPTDRENELARWRSIINDIIQMVYKFQNTFPINDNLKVRFRPFNPSKDKYYEKLAEFLHTNGQVAPHRRTIVHAGEKIIKKLDEIYDDAGDFYADLKRARGHSPTTCDTHDS
ncbi:hypothetical protein Ddc_18083 [Ditylenchus destructor]|nr:hypothetical protein Ddc_18083 [Ditylenchus destructor]